MSGQARMRFYCPGCGARVETRARPWRCGCGSPLSSNLEWEEMKIDGKMPGLWRYQASLPFRLDEAPSLGEGWTPMVPSLEFENLAYKLEFLFPTGSFKDRGSVMVMAEARAKAAKEVVQDSSGNAGASVAAYAARSGIKATIVVPAGTCHSKQIQIKAYKAELRLVEGDRAATAREAFRLAAGRFYASHVWNPFFLEGTKTFAFEVWEQEGFRAPDALFLPAGNGTLLLGAWKGFSELAARQLITRMPRLIACQSARCAPLFAFHTGQAYEAGPTVAEGIAVSAPPRLVEMSRALEDTGGTCVLVEEDEVKAEQERLAGEGLLVEETAAVASAAARKALVEGFMGKASRIVVPLTGSGLKSLPRA